MRNRSHHHVKFVGRLLNIIFLIFSRRWRKKFEQLFPLFVVQISELFVYMLEHFPSTSLAVDRIIFILPLKLFPYRDLAASDIFNVVSFVFNSFTHFLVLLLWHILTSITCLGFDRNWKIKFLGMGEGGEGRSFWFRLIPKVEMQSIAL